jgi:hypothetical protein
VVREREEPLVVRLGRRDVTPVVPESLLVGLPDLAKLVVGHRSDLDAVRERMDREIVDGRPHHLGVVRDRLETCAADERGQCRVAVVAPGLVHLLGRIVLGGDLAEALAAPGEERAADATATEPGVEEAVLPVDARPVRLLIPPDASVPDRLAADLGDQQIAGRIAAHEVVVAGGDGLGRLDPILAFALRARGDDLREVRVVRRIAVHPERDTVEPGTRKHPVIVAGIRGVPRLTGTPPIGTIRA